MLYQVLADTLVIFHFAFVLFVIFGGFLVLWKRYFVRFHLPAVVWGIFIELTGGICPLTPLENMLRKKGGQNTYPSGFIEHYILPILYPEGLTRQLQIMLGCFVFIINVIIYFKIWRKYNRERKHR